jgi:hypothetical protein
MQSLHVPFLPSFTPDWHHFVPHFILEQTPWPNQFPYKPRVEVAIAHDNRHVFLHFRVQEASIRAHTAALNGEVWKDSCVEFFVAPMGDHHYYNFEFNCIGAIRLSSGKQRQGRVAAPLNILQQIGVTTSLGKTVFEEKSGGFDWELSAFIPVSAFFEHPIAHLSTCQPKANFYKCGDDLSVPHYLAWQPIDTPQPDFHRPEFFGQLLLADA